MRSKGLVVGRPDPNGASKDADKRNRATDAWREALCFRAGPIRLQDGCSAEETKAFSKAYRVYFSKSAAPAFIVWLAWHVCAQSTQTV